MLISVELKLERFAHLHENWSDLKFFDKAQKVVVAAKKWLLLVKKTCKIVFNDALEYLVVHCEITTVTPTPCICMKVTVPCGGPWNELINLNFCNLAWIIALFVVPLVTHSVRDRESEKITLSWIILNKYLWGNLAWVRFPVVESLSKSTKVGRNFLSTHW